MIKRKTSKSFHERVKRTESQAGIYIVEFAIVAGVFFFMMFGAIEVARFMFTWSALDAVTQRGARVAAICPLNDPAITQIAVFGTGGGGAPVLPGIEPANVSVIYLTAAGNPTGIRNNTRYVQVSIQNYTHQTLIPATVANFLAPLLTAPPFTTLRPAESLGRHPGGADFC